MDRLQRSFRSAVWAIAEELGVNVIGPECFLVAVVESESPVGQALRACGVHREAILGPSPLDALQMIGRDEDPAGKSYSAGAVALVACGDGVAIGRERPGHEEEAILIATLWSDLYLEGRALLEQADCSTDGLVAKCRELGVSLPRHAPQPLPRWAPPVSLTRDEFEQRAQELRTAGRRYRFNYTEEGAWLQEEM